MKLWPELTRRNVPRMVALYVVTAWLVMQVAEVLIGLGRLNEAYGPLVLEILAVGLPIALILSWFLDGTRADAAIDDAARQARGRRTDFAIIGVLAVALALAAYLEIATPRLEQSVAVLPFEDLTGDVEHSYLADGITEEIRHRLTTFGNLTVIDRYSVDKVRGLALAAIAAKLNVEHVLQGSVRHSGDRVRIAVSLVDAATQETDWSDSYDRDLTVAGLFDVQVEIARAIAEALQAIITPEAEAQMVHAPTRDLEAYRLYLLGKQRMNGNTVAERGEARGFFERAVAIDPEFAEAYAYLALSHSCDPDCMQPAIDKALALDDTVGLAYALRAYLHMQDPAAARQDLERALALGPGDADVWATYGTILRQNFGPDFEGALDAFDRAIALQPLLIETYSEASLVALVLERPAEARAYFERAIAIDPEYADAYWRYAIGLANFGHGGQYYAEAIALLYKAWELDPERKVSLFILSGLCLELGELDGAEALYIASGRRGGTSWILATVYHLRGEHERELTFLESFGNWPDGTPRRYPSMWMERHYIGDGRYDEALAMLRTRNPKLVESLEIDLGCDNDQQNCLVDGLRLAQILEGQGKVEEAAKLWEQLDQLLDQLPSWKSLLWPGPTLIQAARGRKQRALELLRDAVDGGAGFYWRMSLSDPAFDAVRDDPRFQQMVDEIEAEMANQLARVQAMGLACEVPPTWSADDGQ